MGIVALFNISFYDFIMPLSAVVIFIIALAFNLIIKLSTPFLGKFRTGIDSLLFCSITAGYFYGIKAGILYGALIAIAFFLINLRRVAHAPYVVPLNAASGMMAAFLNTTPLITAMVMVMIFYHVISFVFVSFIYRSVGPGYFLFAALNFVTTYALTGFAVGF